MKTLPSRLVVSLFAAFVALPAFAQTVATVNGTAIPQARADVMISEQKSQGAPESEQLRNAGATRVLRINALPTFAMKWLLPRLSRFQRDVPNVELKLSTSNAALDTLDGFDVANSEHDTTVSGP